MFERERTEGPTGTDTLRRTSNGRRNGNGKRRRTEITLGEFFTTCFLPKHLAAEDAAPGTIEDYRLAVAQWKQYTRDPPLWSIDQDICLRFQERLKTREYRGRTIKAITVNNRCARIAKLLRLAGPTNGHGAGYGLIAHVPQFARVRQDHDPPRPALSIEAIESWWDAVADARTPLIPGVEPADWWRALVLWGHNTGFRIKATLLAEWDMIDGHWLTAPGRIMKRRRGGRFYVNSTAQAALYRIRTSSPTIFSWPYTIGHIHTARRKVLDQKHYPERSLWSSQALRRTLLTWLAERNPAVAQLQAGHRGTSVLMKHYVQPEIVEGLLEQVPQPRQAWAWLSGVSIT